MARFGVLALVLCVVAVSACDGTDVASDAKQGGSAPDPTQGRPASSTAVGCSAAIVDRVDATWRSRSIVRGRFGLYGNGADLRTADRWGDSAFWTKIPVILAGDRPATLRVSARDRDRVGLTYGPDSSSPASSNDGARGLAAAPRVVRFEPCRGRSPAAWPGGLALADRAPVHLEVRADGEAWSRLTIPEH